MNPAPAQASRAVFQKRSSRLVDAWSTMLREKLHSLVASEGWKNDVVWAE